jgi:hypothetical protein
MENDKAPQQAIVNLLVNRLNGSSHEEKEKPKQIRKFHRYHDKSIVDDIKEAIVKFPYNQHSGARMIGIANNDYRFIRRMILLSELDAVPVEDRQTLARAIEMLDTHKTVRFSRELADKIVEEHWSKYKRPPPRTYEIKQIQKRKQKDNQKRLDQTLLHIGEGCESTRDMDIPKDLTAAEIKHAAFTLASSIELMGCLMRRLLEQGEDK